ncbi:glycine betaine ABC transporter substrate-binding protein [Oceanobacillus alkalisoli]|uniref:glycine betaine ABC transporter substrate-binding protein n=1 Tax=Oceanobacillus alkalisoli TaxID=2925113 RepID=UPI001EE3BF7F|nr:glycine betaine ABC transporter substrate-binding protein [Oceanobacillus alkalisoli]MCG5104177.1 glycine/betaine ABC transporter [Oceanobacillus alkalisoli]
MDFKKLKHAGLILGILITLLLAACGDSEEGAGTDDGTADSNGDVDYGEAVDYTITGIEPGAGISVTTEAAIEEYDNLQGWNVALSSTGAMMTELDNAIRNEEPIVITGWNPHWMFAAHPDMKYLEDPLEVYGGEESIHSMSRLGFEEDQPEAYKMIDQFEWNVEDMEEIMYKAEETGEDIDQIAAQWVEDNADRVSAWSEGVEDAGGVEVSLVSTPWDSERASSGVLKAAMEQKGFEVEVTEVDVAIVFESLATGDADATLAAWLPLTHSEFHESYKDDIVDMGANLVGAKIGLVVPKYMDVDSIEDLSPNN